MLRASGYTIGAALKDQNYYIIMHGYTGAVDKVTAPVGDFLISNRGKILSIDGVRSIIDDLTLDKMLKRGYITDKTAEKEREVVIKISEAIHAQDVLNSPTSFMFVPSYECNLRCPYCFQDHKMHSGVGKYSSLMTPEQVKSAFNIIDKLSSPGSLYQYLDNGFLNENLTTEFNKTPISLFGGEPLSSVTVPIVSQIVHESRCRGRTVTAITNGVELDLFREHLSRDGISSLQITLDGPQDIHDRRRVGPKFKETFNKIVENVEMALEAGIDVSIRLNIDNNNISNVSELSKLFNDKNWFEYSGFSSNAAAVYTPIPNKNTISQSSLVQLTSSLIEFENSKIESYENWATNALFQCLDGNGYAFRRVAHCAAESGLLIFDPFGDVYSCWEEVGQSNDRIGTYDQKGLLLNSKAREWLSRFPGAIEQCSMCPYALIHTSGCASHAKKISGDIFAAACESFQEYFPATLARAYENFEHTLLNDSNKR